MKEPAFIRSMEGNNDNETLKLEVGYGENSGV